MIQRSEIGTHTQPSYVQGTNDEPSIGTLLKELANESRTLLRQEVELAKVEVSEKVSMAGRNAAYLAAGGLIAYAGLLAIIAAACIGLSLLLQNAMDGSIAAWLGPLIVGVVVAVIGYIFVQKAVTTLKRESLMPRKTINTLRENAEWFKDQVKTTENRMTSVDTPIR